LLGIDALARSLGPKAAQALVIEDSVAGVEAAKAAKLTCIAVTHSYAREELEKVGADLVVDDLDAITDAALGDLAARIGA
jgi:beta-phosphoglucomutase-like phosphatase (HAD superfamily)